MVFEDRVAKYPGRWTMVKSDGTSEIVTLIRNDEPTKEGTPINASTLNELSTVAGAINAKEEAVSAASIANSAAASATQSAQSASADAKSAGNSAASAKAEADRAAAIVSTDKTLSIEGAPADAKAVGDALKGIKLPIATATTLGGVKLSDDFTADADGTLHLAGGTAPDPYPVGSIYQSTARTSPAALFGGTWQEIAQNRVLMGAGSGHAAGTTVEAGLPNITGSFVANVHYRSNEVSGAFTTGDRITSTGANNGDANVYKFSLDASKSNAIYGRSYTVQPAAYYVHIWRRVA
nr:MAG TPA: baseplate protein [Caudoviricetes sp.]